MGLVGITRKMTDADGEFFDSGGSGTGGGGLAGRGLRYFRCRLRDLMGGFTHLSDAALNFTSHGA